MDALLDPLADAAARTRLDAAMRHFYAFTLVLIRMSGLMMIGPLFGQAFVPVNVRVLLVVTMSLLIVPTLGAQPQHAFQRLDLDQNGLLTRDEIPDQLVDEFERLLANSAGPARESLTAAEFTLAAPLPKTLLDYAWAAVGELSLGFALGLGVFTILSGLQVAGDLIDQQSGTSLGEVFNPGFDLTGSLSGQTLYLVGVTVFLCMQPMNGHLLMVSALVETFQTFPVGAAYLPASTIDLLRDLVHQSLVLGLQVAAPLLATMSLVALTMGFLGHTVPQINVLVIGFPIRAVVAILIVALTFTGASQAVIDLVPVVIDKLRYTMTGLP